MELVQYLKLTTSVRTHSLIFLPVKHSKPEKSQLQQFHLKRHFIVL